MLLSVKGAIQLQSDCFTRIRETVGTQPNWSASFICKVCETGCPQVGRVDALPATPVGIMLLSVKGLQLHPDCFSHTGETIGTQICWSAAFICEACDAGCPQIGMLDALQLESQRVTVVGDDYQAIYGFRGAQPDVFQKFIDVYDHPQLQQSLQDNYRYGDTAAGRPKRLCSS